MSGTPILGVSQLPLDRFYNALLKRLFDIVGAAAGLVLSMPFMVGCGLVVYWESPGPTFFRQERMGAKAPISGCTIRSMAHDAATSDLSGSPTTNNDRAACARGPFMRRWNLDELPQFWNVLKGEMSLVGPRPERTYHSVKLKEEIPHYNSPLYAKPGITGWAQVNGSGAIPTYSNGSIATFSIWKTGASCLISDNLLTFLRNKNAC